VKTTIGALGLLVLCGVLDAAQTTIADNVNVVFGNAAGGNISQVRISWTSFTSTDGTFVTAGNATIPTPGGVFSYALTPNIGSTPAVMYTVTLTAGSNQKALSLGVPQSARALTFADCQVISPFVSWGQGMGPIVGNVNEGQNTGNAIAIRGITLASTSLQDGQTWAFNSASGLLEPVTVPVWKKYTITSTQLAALGGSSASILLFNRVQKQKLCGIHIEVPAGFSATSLTSMTVTVGDSNSTTSFYTSTPATVRDTGGFDYSIFGSTFAPSSVSANFSAVGATFGGLTSGSAEISVCSVLLP
jgi:hypothetical protein